MNDHLDECPEVFIDCSGTLCDCEYLHFCICDALRACEARVTTAAVQRVEELPWVFVAGDGHVSVNAFGCSEIIAAIKGDSDE
jgi:hypothetical protein